MKPRKQTKVAMKRIRTNVIQVDMTSSKALNRGKSCVELNSMELEGC